MVQDEQRESQLLRISVRAIASRPQLAAGNGWSLKGIHGALPDKEKD
jgi:hypothetical protein